jgi:hypothetical protein
MLFALKYQQLFLVMFAGWFGFMNIQGLIQHGARPGPRAWSPKLTMPAEPSAGAPPSPPSADPSAPAPRYPSAAAWSMPTAPPVASPATAEAGPSEPRPQVRPDPRRRTFAQEVEVAARALSDDEPALAIIATDRARALAASPDQQAVVHQLENELQRRNAL